MNTRHIEGRAGVGAGAEHHDTEQIPAYEIDGERAQELGAVVLPTPSFERGDTVFLPVLYLNEDVGRLGALVGEDGKRQIFARANQDVSGMHVYHLVRDELTKGGE